MRFARRQVLILFGNSVAPIHRHRQNTRINEGSSTRMKWCFAKIIEQSQREIYRQRTGRTAADRKVIKPRQRLYWKGITESRSITLASLNSLFNDHTNRLALGVASSVEQCLVKEKDVCQRITQRDLRCAVQLNSFVWTPSRVSILTHSCICADAF